MTAKPRPGEVEQMARDLAEQRRRESNQHSELFALVWNAMGHPEGVSPDEEAAFHELEASYGRLVEQLEASRKDASRLRGLIDAGLGREQALQEQLEKLKKDYDDLRDHRVVLVNSSTTQNDESRPEGRPS